MRMLRTTLAGVLTALFVVPITLLSGAAPALADTSQFKGVNWARLGDNFDTGPLVPQGLNLTDDYKTVQAKSDAMLTAFASLGANTVRLPLNPASVGTAWWDSYTAAIDTATAKGFKVVLSYWEEGARGGKIADLTTWNRMWDTVVAKYLPNARVYFDPMNEPHGYSGTEWTDLAARWIGDRPSVPKNRIIVSGIGFDWDIQTLCHDSRFDGTYLAYHHYSWDPDVQNLTTYDAWVADFKARMGNCASRTILEEFGATMDSGLDYNDRTSTDREVLYLRAYTDTARALNMGAIYWARPSKVYFGNTLHDTVNVPAQKTEIDKKTGKEVTIPGKLVIRVQFEDFLGKYVEHCHILLHEDHGMMSSTPGAPVPARARRRCATAATASTFPAELMTMSR